MVMNPCIIYMLGHQLWLQHGSQDRGWAPESARTLVVAYLISRAFSPLHMPNEHICPSSPQFSSVSAGASFAARTAPDSKCYCQRNILSPRAQLDKRQIAKSRRKPIGERLEPRTVARPSGPLLDLHRIPTGTEKTAGNFNHHRLLPLPPVAAMTP